MLTKSLETLNPKLEGYNSSYPNPYQEGTEEFTQFNIGRKQSEDGDIPFSTDFINDR